MGDESPTKAQENSNKGELRAMMHSHMHPNAREGPVTVGTRTSAPNAWKTADG